MRERGAVLRGLVGGVAAIALSLFASGCTYPAAVVLAILLPDDGHSDPVVVANGESGPGPVTNPTVVTGPTRSIESPLTLTLTVADGTTRVVAEVVLPDGSVRPITLSRTGEGTIAGNQIVGIQAAGAARTFTVDWAWRSDFPSVPSIASLQFRVTPDGPTGLGLSTDFGPIALGDTIPSIEFVGPKAGSIVSEQVSLVFRIVDAEFDRARIRVRFERADMPGAPPQDIVLVETGDVLSNLLTAPLSQPGVGGRIFSVRWDTERQIPAGQVVDVTLSVEVFETLDLPSGTVELAGAPAAPLSFTVDNAVDVISTDGPRVDLVDFSSVADSHNEIGFDFIVTDPAGAPVDVVFQWRRLGEPFPALPSPLTPAALAAILADPQQRRDLHVMTEAPLVVRGRVPAAGLVSDGLSSAFRAPELFRAAGGESLVGRTVEIVRAASEVGAVTPTGAGGAAVAGVAFEPSGTALIARVDGTLERVTFDAMGNASAALIATVPGTTVSALAISSDGKMALLADSDPPGELYRVDLTAATAMTPVVAELVATNLPLVSGVAFAGAAGALVVVDASGGSGTVVEVRFVALPTPGAMAPTSGGTILRSIGGLKSGRLPGLTPLPGGTDFLTGLVLDFSETSFVPRVVRESRRTGASSRTLLTLGTLSNGDTAPPAIAIEPGARSALVTEQVLDGTGNLQTLLRRLDLRTGNTAPVPLPAPLSAPPVALAVRADGQRVLIALDGDSTLREIKLPGDALDSRAISAVASTTRTIQLSPPFATNLLVPDAPFRATLLFGPTYSTSAAGTRHRFIWDSAPDLGPAPNENVFIRATPVSATGAGASAQSLVSKDIATDRLDLRGRVPETPPTGLAGSRALSISDQNGDGRDDIAVLAGTTVEIFLQQPDGRFVRQTSPATGLTAASTATVVVAGDLGGEVDADGDVLGDIVVINPGTQAPGAVGSVTLFRRTSAGGYANVALPMSLAFSVPTAGTIADLDGDGLNDLAIADSGTGNSEGGPGIVTVLLQGQGGGLTVTQIQTGVGPRRLSAGDLDGDGRADLVVADQSAIVMYTFDPMSNSFMTGASFDIPNPATTQVAIADVTGDGRGELLAVPTDGNLFVFGPDGGSAVLEVALRGGGRNLATGDLDGDGAADILVSTTRGLTAVYIGSDPSTGLRARTAELRVQATAIGFVATGDTDNDGRLDAAAIVSGLPSGTSLFAGAILAAVEPAGRFTIGDVQPTGLQPTALALGDITNDERVDVAVANGMDTGATLYVQDPSGRLTPHPQDPSVTSVSPLVLPFQISVAIRDLDEDGDGDLLLGSTQSGTQFYFQNPLGLLEQFFQIESATHLAPAHFADSGDIAAAVSPNISGVATEVAVFYRATGFSKSTLVAGLDSVNGLVVGDFNRDGRSDLAATVIAGASPVLRIFLADADGRPSATPFIEMPLVGVGRLAAGDVNGDGRTDIIVANGIGEVFLQDDTTADGPTPGTALGVAATDVAIADVDGDGRDDVVLANNSGGSAVPVAILFTQDATGRLVRRPNVNVGLRTALLALGDVTGDGRLDIVAVNGSDDSVTVLEGR